MKRSPKPAMDNPITPRLVELVAELRAAQINRETYSLDEKGARKAIRDLERIGVLCGQTADAISRLMAEGGLVGAGAAPLEEVEERLQFLDDYLGGIDGYDLTNWHTAEDDKVSGTDEGTLDCTDAFKAIEAIRALLQANEVKRLSNPVDDGAVERVRLARNALEVLLINNRHSWSADFIAQYESAITYFTALEAAEPHP